MSWRIRLAEIAIAGGMVGCGAIPGGTCNANPDPCCYAPDGTACMAQTACTGEPTVTCCARDQSLDGPCVAPSCDPLADNDFDGAGPLARTGHACGADPAIGCYGANFETDIERGGSSPVAKFACDIPALGNEGLRHGAPAGMPGEGGQPCATGYTIGAIEGPTGPVAMCFALCAPGEAYLGNPQAQAPNGLAPHGCNSHDAVGAFGTPASGTENGEHCVFAWRFAALVGVPVPAPTNNTVGLCLDHTKLRYDSDGDGLLDTPWPACATQPVHREPTTRVPDATEMGCVTTTTAGFSAVAATRLDGLPRVPALAKR